MIKIELVGGCFDGEVIEVSPELNMRFNITRNDKKYWFQCWHNLPGKAYLQVDKVQ